MKVLVYSLIGHSTPHFETDLELIKNHLEKGDEVYVMKCDAALPTCMWNADADRAKCARCQSRTIQGLKKAGLPVSKIFNLRTYEEAMDFKAPFFNNLEELKRWKWENLSIGMGVASSLVSRFRDTQINSITHHQDIELTIRTALNVVLNFRNLLRSFTPDRIYLFNGRFAEFRPVLEIARRKEIDCFAHERGADLPRYDLFRNGTVHDIPLVVGKMKRLWDQSEEINAAKMAENWFRERRKGVIRNWYSFTKDQKQASLPASWDPDKKNIVIFNSSEDEFVAVPGWEIPWFQDQNQAIRELVRAFEHDPAFHFYLRVHPNLKGLENKQIMEIKGMNYSNLTIIPSEDTVDTYALMDAAEKVITFGSTMGVEATFWGTPSLLLGAAYYQDLDVAWIPESKEHFLVLAGMKLPPKPLAGALKYGFWQASRGIPFKHFEPEELFEGKFMGSYLGYEPVMKMVRNIQRIVPDESLSGIFGGRDSFYMGCINWMKKLNRVP